MYARAVESRLDKHRTRSPNWSPASYCAVLSTSLIVIAATLFALCNDAFMAAWTSGKDNAPTPSRNELRDLPELIAQLHDQTRPVSLSRWQQFSVALRREISSKDSHREVTTSLQMNLARELNRIRERSPMYAPKRFADVRLRSEALAMLAHPVSADPSQLLNRRLLDGAYRQ